MKKLLIALLFTLAGALNSYASHVMGGDITYVCTGPNTYDITLTLYRDCDGIALNGPQTVDFSSSCGTQTASLPLISNIEVSQLCPTSLGQSTCNGGTLPGTQQIIFRTTVNLAPCSDWVISWDLCCRNSAITNLVNPSTNSLYLETTMNNLTAPCNASPSFLNLPTPYVCVNSLNVYSHAATDIDGDSLIYRFANPLDDANNPIAFAAGYSLNQPMITTAGISLDPATGEMCFTPSQNQVNVISIIVEEWRNGVMIGSVIREMQVVVDASCINQNPTTGVTPTCGGTGGMNIAYQDPSVTQTAPNAIIMCADDSVSLLFSFTDPDPLDLINVISNVAANIPNATFVLNGNNTTSPTATLSWRPTAADGGLYAFSFIIQDNGCPISGVQTFTYEIFVFQKPYAGPDLNICGPQTAQINAINGLNYSWTVLSGDPMVVGTNFSCDTCDTVIATPSITTTYILTSTLSQSCSSSDTVTVNVFAIEDVLGPVVADTGFCIGSSVDLDAGPNFDSYSWNTLPAQPTQIASTQITTFNAPGTYTITTDSVGCILTDTFTIVENPLPIPNFLPSPLGMCMGDSLVVTLANNYASYQWQAPFSSTNSSITIQPSTVLEIFISIQVTDFNGCISDSITIVRNSPSPQPNILGANTIICPGDSLLLTADPATFSSYLWSNGGGVNSTTNAPVGPIQLTVTDSFGCEGTANANVTSQGGPTAAFTSTPFAPSNTNTNILFTDNSSGNIASWSWNFGDGSTSSLQNPSHTYNIENTYTVTLTVFDSNGCFDVFSINYLVQNTIPPVSITIPNVITPNGDGSNDIFIIENGELVDNKLTIYNRWGRKVFEETNYKNNWNAENVSDGTYFYVFEAVLDQSIGLEKIEGTLTILK